MFEKSDGSLIPIGDFNPVELGPFPKCHPRFGEHSSGDTWVKNDEIGPKNGELEADFVYPVGHPKNVAWMKKREEKIQQNKLNFNSLHPSLHLLLLAVSVVYLGCYHSVWLYSKPHPQLDKEDVEKDEDVNQSAIQDGDAYMFPVMGSAVLFGLFVVYKYLDSDWIKFLFSAYVVIMCVNGLGINLGQFIAVYLNSRGLGKFKTIVTIPYFDVPVTWVDVVAYVLSIPLGLFYIQTKNWVANNVMGLSFCVLGLKHIGISSYKTGVIMLCGLFFYDVFWVFGSKSVFGSNVMVTVATGVEAPIKLMFPREQDGCGNMMFSMLGLGDMVVPGIFISLLAKWDISRPDANDSFMYLHVTMIVYTLSLVTTVLIMIVFNHAQPALLYIVPYIIVGSFSVAVFKRQVSALLGFIVEDTMISVEAEAEEDKKSK